MDRQTLEKKMERRSFLGTLAGAVSFLALRDDDPFQRIIDPRFRMLIKTNTGYIQAPGVQVIGEGLAGCILQSERLTIAQPFTTSSGLLLDGCGKVLQEFNLSRRLDLIPGDIISLNYLHLERL